MADIQQNTTSDGNGSATAVLVAVIIIIIIGFAFYLGFLRGHLSNSNPSGTNVQVNIPTPTGNTGATQ